MDIRQRCVHDDVHEDAGLITCTNSDIVLVVDLATAEAHDECFETLLHQFV